jgi:hypothetical protein
MFGMLSVSGGNGGSRAWKAHFENKKKRMIEMSNWIYGEGYLSESGISMETNGGRSMAPEKMKVNTIGETRNGNQLTRRDLRPLAQVFNGMR